MRRAGTNETHVKYQMIHEMNIGIQAGGWKVWTITWTHFYWVRAGLYVSYILHVKAPPSINRKKRVIAWRGSVDPEKQAFMKLKAFYHHVDPCGTLRGRGSRGKRKMERTSVASSVLRCLDTTAFRLHLVTSCT